MNFCVNLISIFRDRNIRYNFYGSRSRAKVISFQPVPPFIFLYSCFNQLCYSILLVLGRKQPSRIFFLEKHFKIIKNVICKLKCVILLKVYKSPCIYKTIGWVLWVSSPVNTINIQYTIYTIGRYDK